MWGIFGRQNMFFGHSITTKLLFFLVWSSTSLTFAQQLDVDWAPEFIPGRPGEVQIEGPIALGNGEYKLILGTSTDRDGCGHSLSDCWRFRSELCGFCNASTR